MGLFGLNNKESNEIVIPDTAYNFSASPINDFYLETENGFLSAENYTPENVRQVISFVIKEHSKSYKRYMLSDVKKVLLNPLFDNDDEEVQIIMNNGLNDHPDSFGWFSAVSFIMNDGTTNFVYPWDTFEENDIIQILNENDPDDDNYIDNVKKALVDKYCILNLVNKIQGNDELSGYTVYKYLNYINNKE